MVYNYYLLRFFNSKGSFLELIEAKPFVIIPFLLIRIDRGILLVKNVFALLFGVIKNWFLISIL
jgi:hypothetical protein